LTNIHLEINWKYEKQNWLLFCWSRQLHIPIYYTQTAIYSTHHINIWCTEESQLSLSCQFYENWNYYCYVSFHFQTSQYIVISISICLLLWAMLKSTNSNLYTFERKQDSSAPRQFGTRWKRQFGTKTVRHQGHARFDERPL
jgi:hypothetical protein